MTSAKFHLPARSGPRPKTGPTVPHEQLSQNAPIELQDELWRRMSTLEGVRVGRSGISRPETRALHLDPALALGPKDAFVVGTEFAHLHRSADGSLHALLPRDLGRGAIQRGWAELHPAAAAGFQPDTLVMLYGPRDEAELETVWELVKASYAFARGLGGGSTHAGSRF
jgi:Luciferase